MRIIGQKHENGIQLTGKCKCGRETPIIGEGCECICGLPIDKDTHTKEVDSDEGESNE